MTLLLFGLFFLFMLLGVPIAFAIGASTLYALYQSGVPLMVGGGDDYKAFRIGLFGLDKLADPDAAVARLDQVLDRVF